MLIIGIVTINIVFLPKIFCQDSLNSVCTLQASGASGTCKLLTNCKPVREEVVNLQKLPQTCGFHDTQPIVCCPHENNHKRQIGDISKEKCKFYSKYATNDNGKTQNECGHNIVKRIVGGVKAGRTEFPHMAHVGFDDNGTIFWGCGGSIISEQFVLTGAQCFYTRLFGKVKYVRVGTTNEDDSLGQLLNILETFQHPEYKPSEKYHDIGLLKVEKSIEFNSYARPACLPYNLPKNFTKVIATGWGKTEFAGKVSDTLQKVTVDVKDYETCNKTYPVGRRLPNGIRDDIHICSGSDKSEQKDTCNGDSGGPIQIYHTADDIMCMYDIVGIISFGKGCFGDPSVNTRVSYYLKWIEDTVWPV